ncbi:MAG: hypothetical protein HY937_09005 [Nitrosomonadales bacterium]|nr:hypothetical protein [Nitrosomonadales bacterium]
MARWWKTQGRHEHPQATQLLMLCDGGGSNPLVCRLSFRFRAISPSSYFTLSSYSRHHPATWVA